MAKSQRWSEAKIHLLALGLVIISEWIGIIPINLKIVSFSLLPMLFALVLGILLSRVPIDGFLKEEEMIKSSSYIGISVMLLIAYTAAAIGPNLEEVLRAGPALILQELGNLGTIFLSIPVAVLVFKMDRTAIGSGFSTSRESSIAVVGSLYGLDSPEGRGVMGSYITGTLLGTIFCGILSSFMLNISWFSPESLAMACGTGSASMMTASLAPLIEAFPAKAERLEAFAATSQVLTNVDGLYMSIFLAIPMAEWLYRRLKGKEVADAEKAALDQARQLQESEEEESLDSWSQFAEVAKVLVLSVALSLVAYFIFGLKNGTSSGMQDTLPGLLWLLGISLVGYGLSWVVNRLGFNLPTVLFVALVSSILSIPQLWPGASAMNEAIGKMSMLPLCTPILAYAGIGTGREIAAFRKQGVNIIIITLLALAGTFIGSAVIANVILQMTGQI